MIKVVGTGKVGDRGVELKHLPSGTAVATLSVASTDTYTDKNGETKSYTSFHKVEVFGKSAETLAASIRAGDVVELYGKLNNRSYDKNGQKVWVTEIKADSIAPIAVSTGRATSGQDESEGLPF